MARDYVLQPFRAAVDFQIDYARELNEQQHAAVTAPPGAALVIAGAGSGKTRTLTYRVAFLIEQGIPPDRILLLTFTNKAAREMMKRVADLLGNEISALWGGTFHSVGNRVLRRHAELLGYRKDFTIMDREDATDLIDACVAESDIDIKETRFPKAEVLGDIFSLAANMQCGVKDVIGQHYEYFEGLSDEITAMQGCYQARKRATNAMDFDDLLHLWLKLLQDHADVRELYQRRFQFVLVDEYQDTNKLQGDLIDLLAARHHNVMVVGDDSQSIYSWRGANFKNIIEFPQRYPETRVFKIETNYRSTPEILAVANAVISANVHQFAKELTPARKSGSRPTLVPCNDSSEQAVFVAQRVLELRDEGVELSDMAVLYRSHFHALEVQMEFTRRNIPFSITSGIRFFEQAHIKDVAAHLRLVCNAQDELAAKRVLLLLPGIGGKGAEKIWKGFQPAFADALLAAPEPGRPRVAAALQQCASLAPKKSQAALAQLTATLAQLETQPVRGKAGDMIRLVLQAGYEDYLEDTYKNFRNRLEDIQQLAVFAGQFESPEDFLSQLALMTNIESESEKPASRDTEQIRLSTIHQAKGLEFDVVFMIMLCDGLFPSAKAMESFEGEEEERRLFYVAVTRARNELYLSHPIVRVGAGSGVPQMCERSRFLNEIPKELLDELNLRPFGAYY